VREPRDPTAWILAFTLPPVLRLGVTFGRYHPCKHGCLMAIDPNFKVRIAATSDGVAKEQARWFLETHAEGHGRLSIVATMLPPGRPQEYWRIEIDGEVEFQRGFARMWPPVGEVA
jgi:hypothetical protein